VAFEVIVADNASHDGSAAMVRAEFPQVSVLEMGGNVGFGAANNAAVATARGRNLCFLNSDAILREIYERTGDRPFERIDAVISARELKAISDRYKGIAGYDKATLQA
jgi:GT2 family glycosyltransferase